MQSTLCHPRAPHQPAMHALTEGTLEYSARLPAHSVVRHRHCNAMRAYSHPPRAPAAFSVQLWFLVLHMLKGTAATAESSALLQRELEASGLLGAPAPVLCVLYCVCVCVCYIYIYISIYISMRVYVYTGIYIYIDM